jgi:hypothetical protein
MILPRSSLLSLLIAAGCGNAHDAGINQIQQKRSLRSEERHDELMFIDVTNRPTNKPVSVGPQSRGGSIMSFDKLFEILNEHDRNDELLWTAVTRSPTEQPSNEPTTLRPTKVCLWLYL